MGRTAWKGTGRHVSPELHEREWGWLQLPTGARMFPAEVGAALQLD